MGGVTTWDVLAYQSEYFSYFMPMAGDSWLSQAEDVSDDDEFADRIAKGISDNGLSSDDFRIVAMVGQDDGTNIACSRRSKRFEADIRSCLRTTV